MRSLGEVPFLSKQEALAHQHALVARGTAPFSGVVSSGTQVKDGVLRVPRTAAEARALGEWLGTRDAAWTDDGLVLEVRAVHHGVEHLAPQAHWLRVPWSYSRNAFRLVESLLSRAQPGGRRVTRLLINAGALMPLTAHFLERGVDARRFGLRGISTTGFRLSPHWRARVREAWGAPVFDNFSLSEIPSPALECERCAANHWLPPPVWPEVVDPLTRAPVRRGIGVLVLTTLWPFVQAMPLLRYWTGDLVELRPRCPETGERGIRFRGRAGQSVVAPDGVLVAAQDVVDALEAEPLVARYQHPVEQLGLIGAVDCGAVKFELSGPAARRGAGDVTLRVELKFDPRAYPADANALGHRVARALLARSPALRARERRRAGDLVVELVSPGTLRRAWTKW
ncbi:MAG: hypothetical protein SFW67_00125 [Myxococcaceae bacterium]|nr:hypothetical protein [Myxococcaceae bacterium]